MAQKKAQKKQKKEEKRRILAVVFDVSFPAEQWVDISIEEAARMIFAKTSPMRFRGEDVTKTFYVTGEYRKDGTRVWTGQFHTLKEARPATVVKNKDGDTEFKVSEEEILTEEMASAFAFAPVDADSGVLVYWERASLPHTRLATYVRRACREHELDFSLTPRRSEKGITEAIEAYDVLQSISVAYRHSQSPGNPWVDTLFDETGAKRIRESFVGDDLNKNTILSKTGKSRLGKVINHIEENDANGAADLRGTVGGETIPYKSNKQIQRKSLEVLRSAKGIMRGLVDYVIKIAF